MPSTSSALHATSFFSRRPPFPWASRGTIMWMRRTASAIRLGMAIRSTTGSRNSAVASLRSWAPDTASSSGSDSSVAHKTMSSSALPRALRAPIDGVELAPEAIARSARRFVVVEEGRELGQEDGHRAHLPEQPHRPVRGPAAQQAEDLLEDARSRGPRQLLSARDHRVVDIRLDPEVEPSCEADGAQDTDRILAEADDGVTDRVDSAARDVFHAAAPVEDLPPVEVVEERVDREVAANGVLVGVTEHVVAADQQVVGAVGVVRVDLGLGAPPKRGDLDDLPAAEQHVRQPEASADDTAVAKQRADVLGAGAGRDVVVLRCPPEQQVAHAPADEVGLKPAALQPSDDPRRIGVEPTLREVDGVAHQPRARVTL